MFQHFEINLLKDVRVAIFAINVGGKIGFRAIIYDPFDFDKPNEKNQSYEIYDDSSVSDLVRLVFGKYVGVSRGSKNIVATIKTEPPGQLQFIKEKRQLVECHPLSAEEIKQLIYKLEEMFGF
jgi:hypothetical protein